MEEKTTSIPVLTLDPTPVEEEKTQPAEPVKSVEELIVANAQLSPEEIAAVDNFAKQIDITNASQIMMYGSQSQQKLSQFSESALSAVRTKDLGETGVMIADLIGELKGFSSEEDKKGLLGIFKKKAAQIEALKLRYDKAEVNVERIAAKLDEHQVVLLKDIAMLDDMYQRNLDYFKELSMYILAGKKKLENERATTLPELLKKAEETKLPEDAQKARDFADVHPLREEDLRPGADEKHQPSDGAPDSPHSEQRHHDGGEDPNLHHEHHSPLEEPDGALPRTCPCTGGYCGAACRYRYDERTS